MALIALKWVAFLVLCFVLLGQYLITAQQRAYTSFRSVMLN